MRTFLLTLFAALVAFPAQASASSACFTTLGPYAPASQDQTVVANTNWQTGSPAGTVDIPLQGSNVSEIQYTFNCSASVTTVLGDTGTATITGQGPIRFTHRVRDLGTGQYTDWADEWIQIDSGAPSNTTAAISTDWRKGPATYALTATDATSPVHTEWALDGGAFITGPSALVDGTGTHTLKTAAVDAAGNRDERTDTVNIDNDAPTDTTDTAPVGWQSQPVDLEVDGTDGHSGVDHVEWQVDTDTPGSGPDGTIIRIGTQGQHVLRTRVIDEVGNVSAWRSQDVWVNFAGPSDTTTVASTWYTTPTVNVNLTATTTGSGISRIQWRLDGQPGGDVSNPPPSGVPVSVAGDGVHTLEVRITDAENHVLDWQPHQVKIDTVHPADTTAVSGGWLALSSLNVNVRGSDANSGVARVEWRIDGGSVDSATTDRHDVAITGDGVHTLETRVVDNAGLTSAWTSRTVKLDSSPPTNLTPAATSGWRNTPYSVVLDAADGLSGVAEVGWRVQLQGSQTGAERTGAAGATTASINFDGTHLLETRVRDLAGNYSGWRQETIQIDRVAPTDDTTYPSANVGNRHVITFSPSDDRSGVAGIEWELDGGGSKTTPTVTITGDGTHSLRVRVRDNAGNYSAWVTHPITVQIGLDTVAPTDNTTLPTGWYPANYTVTVAASDDVDGTGVEHVEWRLDDEEIKVGQAGARFDVTTDGVHSVDTRVFDNAGNHTNWKSQTLRIDKTKPVDATVWPSGWGKERVVSLTATDAMSGVSRITYDVTGAGTASGTFNADQGTITLPADGTYTITYSIFDVAGQRTNRSLTYKVDSVVPVNTSAAAPTAWRTALTLALTGTDAASGVDHAEWRVDQGTANTGNVSVTTEGTQQLETRIVDKAGNVSDWRAETIKVDHTAPVNTTPHPAAAWRTTDYTTTVAGTDPLSGVARIEYTLDGGATLTTPNVTITAEGAHKLRTRVVDVAGNVSEWRTDDIGIDRTAPALSADCGSGWHNTAVTCSVGANGGPSGLTTLTADDTAVSGGSYTVSAEGTTTVHFRAVDGAGNEAATTADVNIDTVAPAPAVACTPGEGTSYLCTASAGDAASGVAGLAWSVDGSAPAAIANGAGFTVTKGSVVVYATDVAGNAAASAAVSIADRPQPATPPTPRTKSEAVYLKKGSGSRLLGQLAILALPDKTTIDLRPLALGKGTFQLELKITTAHKTKTVSRTQTTKTGYSSRISLTVPSATRTAVTLTVRKKSGKHWVTYASAAAKL